MSFLRFKHVAVHALDPFRFLIRQPLEFSCARPVRKTPAIVMQEPEQQVDSAAGHIGDRLKAARKLVVAPEKVRLVRQVVLDRPAHLVEQELGMRRGVKEAIEVRGIVEHPDISALRRLPLDEWQEPPRMILQNRAIHVDPIQDRG